MTIPNRITLSKTSTNKLQSLKKYTGITPNIMSRIAIMLAINSNHDIKNTSMRGAKGQVLEKDTLFGEQIDIYEIVIRQYISDNAVDMSVALVIASLVDIGVHKMGNIRSLEQLCSLS